MQNTIWFLLLMGLKITPLLPYAIPFWWGPHHFISLAKICSFFIFISCYQFSSAPGDLLKNLALIKVLPASFLISLMGPYPWHLDCRYSKADFFFAKFSYEPQWQPHFSPEGQLTQVSCDWGAVGVPLAKWQQEKCFFFIICTIGVVCE